MAETIFYDLPAEFLVAGLSTDDGQEIVYVHRGSPDITFDVYTPRPDDPEADADNRCNGESRVSARGKRVHLGVFEFTKEDRSGHPLAGNRRVVPGPRHS